MTDQVPLYLIAVENPEGILSMVTEQSVDGVEIVRGNGSGGVLLKLADGIIAELRGVRYMDQ